MTPTKIESRSEYEKLARRFIEGVGGLFDLYKYEGAIPLVKPKEVEGAMWILACLTNPKNRDVLEQLLKQNHLREQREQDPKSTT